MKIRKITDSDTMERQMLSQLYALNEENAPLSDKKVQGARLYQSGNILFADSPRRFKLYTQSRDILLIREGEGHFKWARGEIDFKAGEAFEISETGEYEVNGKCIFAVYRCK